MALQLLPMLMGRGKGKGGINPLMALQLAQQAIPVAQGLKGLFGLGKGGRRSGGRRSGGRGGMNISQGLQLAQQALPIAHGLKGLFGLGKGGRRLRGRGAGGAVDGRTARAQVVREVMAERGCTLPEASRIVKSEGLY
jgi:hypothetical protein